jgi:hypothetical protein
MENSFDYQCIKIFLNTGKVGELLGRYKLDPNMIANMVRKYTEFLQVPQEWETFDPPSVREFMKIVVNPKTLTEFEEPMEDTIPNLPKEMREHKKAKSLGKNLGVIKVIIDMIKDLTEHEYVYEE